MNKSIIVATATEQVLAPVEFTGKLKSVNRLSNKETGEQYISLEIEGMPALYDDKGRKVTVLRTVKQAINDLRFFAHKKATAQEAEINLAAYAIGQNVTLNVSAHEAGALFPVTPESNYHTDKGGKFKTGELVTLEKAGFYVEGFLNIQFAKEDMVSKARELALASAAADESEF